MKYHILALLCCIGATVQAMQKPESYQNKVLAQAHLNAMLAQLRQKPQSNLSPHDLLQNIRNAVQNGATFTYAREHALHELRLKIQRSYEPLLIHAAMNKQPAIIAGIAQDDDGQEVMRSLVGNQALYYAALRGDVLCVQACLDGGVNPRASKDWNAFNAAEENNHHDILTILMQHSNQSCTPQKTSAGPVILSKM